MDSDKNTIFLVDDNKTNLETAYNTLSGSYKVFTLDSGTRLFKILEKIIPDLILLDIEMPEMDGYQILERLKSHEKYANIPVIFLTALTYTQTELKGLTMGAIDYITKPFLPQLLLKRIDVHLQLIDYRHNLEQMVKDKTTEIVTLKNAVLKTTAELVEQRDKTTGYHIERTERYIEIMMCKMKERGVYKDEVNSLDMDLVLQSSQLHDVGKISIKDSILLKPGELTAEEFEEMKKHTTFGEAIIARIKESTTDSKFLDYASIFAVSHHEKWDGSGYPRGLKGEDIPLLGRVMAIADVYDALITKRPYKEADSHDVAVSIIKDGRGTHFDPQLVDLFLDVNSEFEKVSMEFM